MLQKESGDFRHDDQLGSSSCRKGRSRPGCLRLTTTGSPFISSVTGCSYESVSLSAGRVCTFGREKRWCDFYFTDRRISRRHCQILFDARNCKVLIIDGVLRSFSQSEADKAKRRLHQPNLFVARMGSKRSLNGVYMNGCRLKGLAVIQLSAGDSISISLVCGNDSGRGLRAVVGFVIDMTVLADGIVRGNNLESSCRSVRRMSCDRCSMQEHCMWSVYERLSKLCSSRTITLKEVTSQQFRLSDVELSQDSIDSLCGRLLQAAGEHKLVTNGRRTSNNLQVNGVSTCCALPDGSTKPRNSTGGVPEALTNTNKLLIVTKTYEKRCLKCECFKETDSDRELLIRALLLLRKCRGVRKKLKDIVYIGNQFRSSSPGLDRIDQRNVAAFTEGSFPSKTHDGTCSQFSRHNTLQNRNDRMECDRNFTDNGRGNLAKDADAFGTEEKVENARRISLCNPSLSSKETPSGSACAWELESREKVSKIVIDVIEQTSNKSMNETASGLKKSVHALESDGRILYLNRLESMDKCSRGRSHLVSLTELLSPVESLSRIFAATFTSDVPWFLSSCKIPNHLPITVACHDAARCWSADHEQRSSQPYSEYPNLVVVYPPFPDEIAIAKDKKKRGVACHHPKLLLLQREDSMRVVITSANLVPKQWNHVTNTVWWQDFPRRSSTDLSSMFIFSCGERGETSEDSSSDFLAQLAGFVASLVVDIPNQACWIKELYNYDFGNASGYLIASVPGIHESKFPHLLEHIHYLTGAQYVHQTATRNLNVVGSVLASVVGLSHRFQMKVDPKGARLKVLAGILQKCRKNAHGMLEVILQRNHQIPADANAISVIIDHIAECFKDDAFHEDHVQLGFLQRSVARWVAPLCDAGLFSFSAYIFPEEVLATALSGSNSRVKLVLYVSKGLNFATNLNLIEHENVVAICHLLASIQRNLGIWRLHEVLTKYQWHDSEELDFVYGASSIGTSLNSHFLAAFATAAGKRSSQYLDSEESDPEWGTWNAEYELRRPSIKILFPTIDRVKTGQTGIWPYRCLLSFSERTWQRLKYLDILHDAVPCPSERVGHPMHVKVAQRRFQNKATSSTFGWIYFGSHNFSAAAWGCPLTKSPKGTSAVIGSSVLGSRLHICNYELGILLIVPPPRSLQRASERNPNLDDLVLPFVVPAPKYQINDRPATMQAMREACIELEKEKMVPVSGETDLLDEEIVDVEEEIVELTDGVIKEEEEEKLYAEALWSQMDPVDA